MTPSHAQNPHRLTWLRLAFIVVATVAFPACSSDAPDPGGAAGRTMTAGGAGTTESGGDGPGGEAGVDIDGGGGNSGSGGGPITGDSGGGAAPIDDAGGDVSTGGPDAAPSVCTTSSNNTIGVMAGTGAGSATQTIKVDGTGKGRAFDGIGAVSGGGGNSRLLFDYPEPQRSEILDYLFKPGYGASLQILKAEIGGDTQSTDGAEPSHMHSAKDLSCARGYEWWLMSEARARNPKIKLYGLSWGAPGWIGGGKFWSTDNVDYHIAWLNCAKMHGLTIDYLGGWNEKGFDKTWYAAMHAAIASNGFATKLVGADTTNWSIADEMVSDAAFKQIVDVIGVHYPCGYKGAEKTCNSTANAVATGRPLWASENGSEDYKKGAQAMARSHNRLYLDGKMTGSLNWPLISSLVPNLSWEGTGLAVADQPWSGWYDLGLQLWVTAHTTQFTQPGWTYIDASSGYIAGNRDNGSFVTLKSPTGGDYSVIIETIDATSPRTVAFQTSGGLSTGDVHVWATDMASKSAKDYFVHAADLSNAGGSYWVTLEPNHVYTITTITTPCKGMATSPASKPSDSLPYSEKFEGYPLASEAHLISDMEGSFEVAPCGAGRSGQCYRQAAPLKPIAWARAGAGTPFTLVGTADWTDYKITADVMLEAPGSVELMGRFTGFVYGHDWQVDGYYMSVSDTGAWSIYANNKVDGVHKTLASGKVAALGTNKWHTIVFGMKGATLTAAIDGATVGTASDATWKAGPAGLSVGSASNSWLNAQFDNLTVVSQ